MIKKNLEHNMSNIFTTNKLTMLMHYMNSYVKWVIKEEQTLQVCFWKIKLYN